MELQDNKTRRAARPRTGGAALGGRRRVEAGSAAFLAPAIALLAALVGGPLAVVVWLGLRRVMPVFGIDRFVGLANVAHLLADARLWSSVATTLYFAVVAVSIELVFGLALALLLHRTFPGRALARAAALVPWALPAVVAARMWEWIYDPGAGLLNYLVESVGLAGGPVSWLADPFWAIHAAIVADAWKSTPFAALILLAGLAAIPVEIEQAARVDGARGLRLFGSITLPLLRPALVVAALFRLLDSLRVFDAIYVLTGGGPANTTETTAIYTYKVLFQTLRFGYGSALALAAFLLAAAASAAVLLVAGRGLFVAEEGR